MQGIAQIPTVPAVEDTALANSYSVKAEKLAKEAQYDSSNFYFEKASVIYEKVAQQLNIPSLWANYVNCYNRMGEYSRVRGDYNKGIVYLHKALETGTNKLGDTHLSVAACYNGFGRIHLEMGEHDKALEFHRKALTIYLEEVGPKRLEVAESYNQIGSTYEAKGRYEKALEFHQKALAIYLQMSDGEYLGIPRSYYYLGIIYHAKGNYDKALEFHQQALAIYVEAYGKKGLHVGNGYLVIGNIYERKGEYDKALEFYQSAISIYIDIFGEKHLNIAVGYNNVATIYLSKAEYDKALEFFQKSIAIFADTIGENHPRVAHTYRNIGNTYSASGKYDKALQFQRKSLSLFAETLGLKHPNVAYTYAAIGRIHMENRDYENALEFHRKAVLIQHEVLGEKHPALAYNYRKMGDIYKRSNDIQKALSHYQKSLMSLVPSFSDSNIYLNPPLSNSLSWVGLLNSLEAKADAFIKRKRLTPTSLKDMVFSLSTYSLSSELIDQIRSSYTAEGSKLLLAEATRTIYEKAIQASLQVREMTSQRQYLENALVFAEKSKATVLSQSLQESQAKQFASIPDSLLEQERDLRIDLAFYETEVLKEGLKTENQDSLRLREVENIQFALKREYENLINQLENSYPKYYDIKYRIETASVPDLQDALDEQTALLEYFVGDSAIYVFAVTNSGFNVISVQRDSSFDAIVSSLANSFKSVTSKEAYLKGAAQLYSTLIKPVKSLIADKYRWVIIPDGELYQIPFEALLNESLSSLGESDYKDLNYVIREHELVYHYSATLWLQSQREHSPRDFSNEFVGFAPVFTKENSAIASIEHSLFSLQTLKGFWAKVTRDGTNLDELPYSEQEVRTISKMLPKKSGQVYVHENASEENFKNKIKDSKFVHVATHGFINSENPKLSNLAFSQPQDSTATEDGFLYSAETYNLDLNADLLVLSACQSGTGQLIRGEGLMALTRGFLYSGARNIIASLWKVFDEHTSILMVELYKQIFTGKSYSAALREAKLKMIQNEATAGPQSWASFVLIGGGVGTKSLTQKK